MTSDNFDCPLCLEPFVDACTTSCGHTFCAPCLMEYWQKEGENKKIKCPIDRSLVSMIIPNYVVRKEVQQQNSSQHQNQNQNQNQNANRDGDKLIETYNTAFSGDRDFTTRVREDWVVLNYLRAGGSSLFNLLVYITAIVVLVYLFLPWDLIPDDLGIIGYCDDIAFIIAGIWFLLWVADYYRERLISGHTA